MENLQASEVIVSTPGKMVLVYCVLGSAVRTHGVWYMFCVWVSGPFETEVKGVHQIESLEKNASDILKTGLFLVLPSPGCLLLRRDKDRDRDPGGGDNVGT